MLNWLRKDPLKALEQEYAGKLKAATDLQRNGDLLGYADLTAEAEEILSKIDKLQAERGEQENESP